ncbi:MAG TPA: PRC-barrel domain-containing protein [Bryobacteraceae bacterium]|nr:PRC-barrel domain-containing protein [Bryobacteraceae bacterium]
MARDDDRDRKMSGTTQVDTRPDTEPDWDQAEGRRKYRRVMPAGGLMGERVRNSAGDSLGKVEEIMLDVPTGRIAYAVLSFGGALGIGKKLFAVPWEALTLNDREHEFVLNVDKQTLEDAPGFDKENWPDMADPAWGSKVHRHYGYRPYWESAMRKTDELDRREREGTFDRDRNPNLR